MFLAWKANCSSNEALIKELKEYGIISSPIVAEVMRKVDRGNYTRDRRSAYVDSPQPIGDGQTISAPHMHAAALQYLEKQLRPGCRALDVGCGSGYLSACMGLMVGSEGKVIGIDIHPDLVEWAIHNISRDQPHLLESKVVSLKVGDGWRGEPDYAPFDAIHVGAAAANVPKALVNQLKEGGRMVIPVGPQGETQELLIIDKLPGGEIKTQKVMSVMYVPLVKRDN